MSDQLPEGWETVALGDLFNFKYGKGLPQESRNGQGSVDVYGSNGIVGVHNAAVTSGPTIIIGRKGSVGEVHLSSKGCWPIDTTYFVDEFPSGAPPAYWALYLKSLRLGQQEKSSAIPGISREDIYAVEVPVPPLPEQHRIVAKLEQVLAKVDSCQQRLVRIPLLLKRFRQSVLAAACSGRLTSDWREQTALNYDAEADFKSYLASSQHPRHGIKRADPTEGHEIVTDEVPCCWVTPPIGDLFRFIDYRGKTPKKSASGKRLISAKNIKMGYVSEEPVEYVSEDFYCKWMTRGFPRPGDIFFVTEGHTMGFTALNTRTDQFALSQRTITLQPSGPLETRCFLYFMMSPKFQSLVAANATGSAAVGIKAAKFRGLPIPFPALPEQREIVRRVESLFAIADQIEARYTKAQHQVDKLTPSLLAKAFRGELVPQDPNDEPAAKLLERIRVPRNTTA